MDEKHNDCQKDDSRKADDRTSEGSDVFEVEKIRELVELMKEHDLSEIDLHHKPRRIRLRRGSDAPPVMGYPIGPQVPLQPTPASTGTAPTAQTLDDATSTPAHDASIAIVESPTVGTFYLKPKPDAPPFVKIGDQVEPDTTVCLVANLSS